MEINNQTTIVELAQIIGKKLAEHNLDVVLVGGACVSIYSQNKYISGDLDMISYADDSLIRKALAEIDFTYAPNKYYINPKTEFFIEFINPPVAIGTEPVYKFSEIKTSLGQIKLLTPTDCVKDRLAGFYHWNDRQSLEQAIMVAIDQKVSISVIKKWSSEEGHAEKYAEFYSQYLTRKAE